MMTRIMSRFLFDFVENDITFPPYLTIIARKRKELL